MESKIGNLSSDDPYKKEYLRRNYWPSAALDLPSYFSHGRSFSTLFSAIGWRLASMNRASLTTALLLTLGGVALLAIETTFLATAFGIVKDTSAYFATIPLSIGVFLLALALPEFGRNSLLPKLAPLTLGIYLIHVLVLEGLELFRPIIHPVVWDAGLDLTTYAVSAGIIWVLLRIPGVAFLVQGEQAKRPNRNFVTLPISPEAS